MLWHHLFLNTAEYGSLTRSLAVVFKVCVALFLFVSGYGLTKQFCGLGKRTVLNTIQLMLRRFINFFLLYWFCFILVTVIGNLCGHTFHDAYPATRNMFKCVALDFFGQMGYDSYLKPWWFNKMIIQLYLVLPFLYMMLYNRYSAFLGLVAIVLVQLFAKRIPGNVFFIVEGGMPAFYLGMLASRFQAIPTVRKPAFRIVLGTASVLLGVLLSVLLLRYIKNPYLAVLVRALLALCLVVALKSFGNGNTRMLCFVGKYASIMYLTHVLLIILLPKFVYFPSFSILVFLLFAIACLAIAMMIDWLERVLRYDKLRQLLLSAVNH